MNLSINYNRDAEEEATAETNLCCNDGLDWDDNAGHRWNLVYRDVDNFPETYWNLKLKQDSRVSLLG